METNGLHFQDLPLDWWTVSPKDAAAYRVHPRLWPRISEIKLLVTPGLDMAVLKKFRARSQAPIVLQPEWGARRKYRLAYDLFAGLRARRHRRCPAGAAASSGIPHLLIRAEKNKIIFYCICRKPVL